MIDAEKDGVHVCFTKDPDVVLDTDAGSDRGIAVFDYNEASPAAAREMADDTACPVQRS